MVPRTETGRVMINLDANYGAADFADTADLPENHAHHQIQDELMQECEDIKRQLPISSFLRPAWDLETLSRIGVEEFSLILVSANVFIQKKTSFIIRPRCFDLCEETEVGSCSI